MLFSGRVREPGIRIRKKDIQITRVCVTKFLGVLVDESLNRKDHINRVKSKLSITIGINAAKYWNVVVAIL